MPTLNKAAPSKKTVSPVVAEPVVMPEAPIVAEPTVMPEAQPTAVPSDLVSPSPAIPDDVATAQPATPATPAVSAVPQAVPASVVNDIPDNQDRTDEQFPGDLVNDAPGHDTTDIALASRAEAYNKADALGWLLEGQESAPEENAAQPPAAEDNTSYVNASKRNFSFAGKVLTGFGEGPIQAVGGVRDAAQNMLDLGEWFEKVRPVGGPRILNDKGQFDPGFAAPGETTHIELPNIRAPETAYGKGVRAITQFLIPFGGVGKLLGGLRGATTLAIAGRAAVAGGITDFVAMASDEGRLSDLLIQFPSLKNPVTEWLSTDEEDSVGLGRVKNAVEGLALGVFAEGLFKGIKLYKSWRTIKRTSNADELAAEVLRTATDDQMVREATSMKLLGSTNETVPLIVGRDVTDKLRASMKVTEAGVPDEVLARSLTDAGLTPLIGADGVYVNFARFNVGEDIQRVIQDTASAYADDIVKAQRGVVTHAETKLSAEQVDAWDMLMKRRSGDALNAAQTTAARGLWATSGEKLFQIADVASNMPTPENLFQFRRMLAIHHTIQKEVLAARSEAARTLNAWGIPIGGSAEKMLALTKMLDNAGGVEVATEMARRIQLISRSPDSAKVLSRFAELSVKSKTIDSVFSYWRGSILSGFKTHAVNMMSNASIVGLSVFERAVAARYGRIFTDEAGVEIGEAMAQILGIRASMHDAFRNAGKAWQTGQTGWGLDKVEAPFLRPISSGYWNVRSDSLWGRAIDAFGAITNIPGRALSTADEFFKTMNYRGEISAQAHRMVVRESRGGSISQDATKARMAELIDNPPEAMRMEGAEVAAYNTFTNDPGKFTRGIQRLLSEWPLLKYALPFTTTPANIFKYAFERTPLAPLTAKYRNAIAEGGAAADMARTRLALGTMMLMESVDLAMHGHITGSGPGATAERQNWLRQGNRPYSIRIGNKVFRYSRLDPLGYIWQMGADIAEYTMNSQDDEATAAEIEEMMAATIFSVAEGATSKSYMQGMSNLVEAIESPDQRGPGFVERWLSSFIPTMAKDVAVMLDPTQRAAHDIWSAFQARIPGMRDDLPAKRDLFGREISYQSGLGLIFDAVSPIYGSTYNPEPIDLAMEKDGWFIGIGGNGVTIQGQGVSFRNRPDTKYRFFELRGGTKPSAMGDTRGAEVLLEQFGDKTMLETLNDMVTGKGGDLSDLWNEAELPEDRENLAKKVVFIYGKVARTKLIEEYPWIMETARRRAEVNAERFVEPE